MEQFEYILTSYDEQDEFVVEIWYRDKLIAIVQENGDVQKFKDSEDVPETEFEKAVKTAWEKLNRG